MSLSLFSSLIAWDWALVKLDLGGWEDLRTLLISALSSSASCWPNLVHTDSIAMTYSRLGGCLWVTTKLGPLASTDLCAWVKGLLDKLITQLGLRSSNELSLGDLLALFTWLLSWTAWGSSTNTLGVSAIVNCLWATCLLGGSINTLGVSADS